MIYYTTGRQKKKKKWNATTLEFRPFSSRLIEHRCCRNTTPLLASRSVAQEKKHVFLSYAPTHLGQRYYDDQVDRGVTLRVTCSRNPSVELIKYIATFSY